MKPQDLIGKKFSTEGDGKASFKIVGVFANGNQLELKQIPYNNKLTFRPLLGSRIGIFYGKLHMPVPRAFGEVVW